MAVRIYNSLTRQKEELQPLDGQTVRMYTCGVTVYDRCHIGHARSLYVFEVIRRYLTYRGLKVKFARNITDIDDKIINKARELKKGWAEVVQENIDSYYQDLLSLGIPPADIEPRATENIDGIIEDIQGLLAKGKAYEKDGSVYYDVKAFADYGKLSKQSIDHMLDAVRIEADARKKDPLDFALWKKSKDGEPAWDSPWGQGRPGWHIECSCMSRKHLGTDTLDIHGGGRDLIFPHHENEIAQAEGLTGKPFARAWVHSGLLTIHSQKMAKSLGNFITIQDALKKYGGEALKFFYLSAHYASAMDFTDERMEDACKHRQTFDEFFDKVSTWLQIEDNPKTAASEKDLKKIAEFHQAFLSAMDDDFNTPEALAAIFGLVDLGARLISANKVEAFRKVKEHLQEYFRIFVLPVKKDLAVPSEVKVLLSQRIEAKKNKDFAKADEIREAIRKDFRLNVVDTAGGVALTEAAV